jgi:hypothetical protein
MGSVLMGRVAYQRLSLSYSCPVTLDSSLEGFLWMFSQWVAGPAYFAYSPIAAARRAIFTAIKNDLQMKTIPVLLWE